MAGRQTIIEAVRALLKAGALPAAFGVEEADYADLVGAALARYSRDRPLVAFVDFAGDGERFDFSLPGDWDEALSRVRAVEYPQGGRAPSWLRGSEWTLYARGTPAQKFRLLRHVPAGGETLRVFYTLCHTADDTRTSVPESDLAAVAWLAAAEGCHLLARRFAQTTSATIAADAVDYPNKAGEYTRLAHELERKYRTHVGEGERARAAGASLDWDGRLSGRRGEYFSHGAPEER